MAAFNYIVFDASCPHCKKRVVLRAQTHIASDYEGDRRGRFMDREYRLGERMHWFDASHPDVETWKTWGGEGNKVHEDCPAVCPNCATELRARIVFEDVTPVLVVELLPSGSPPKDRRGI